MQDVECRMSTLTRDYPIVQISLDLTTLDEALETAAIAVEAGVDWLEAGTPLILAQGLRAVEALRTRFPDHPIVADLKTMDGGYLEAEMMAKAGASCVVVMGRAHEATIRRVVFENPLAFFSQCSRFSYSPRASAAEPSAV